MMQLYYNLTSPYARKARVAVIESGLGERVQLVETDPWAEPADLLAATPLSKVPTLVTDTGLRVTESDTIAQTLHALSPTSRLLPDAGPAHIAVLARSALAQGLIDAAFICVLEQRRPAPLRWPDWEARQHRAIARTLAVMEAELDTPPGRFDLGDLAWAVALSYLSFRLPQVAWTPQHPRLGTWLAQVAQRESMRATQPA
jgi:glutathione S-transferase